MSANRYEPHVLVLPEDDANRDIVIGFRRNSWVNFRQLQVEDVAGGWLEVVQRFEGEHVREMRRLANRHVVLLIDLDGHADRIGVVKARVPPDLADRVYVLGALTEPEEFRRSLGPFEEIGMSLANDCQEGTDRTWGHELLRHNAAEVDRMRERVRGILFQSGRDHR